MKIIINEIPPSNNKFMGNSNSYHIYGNLKKQWDMLLRLAIGRDKPKQPIDKSIVTIKYYFGNNRRHDPDNYSGKLLLDPLVKYGIIKDDSFKHISLKLEADYDKENPRTEITITEV